MNILLTNSGRRTYFVNFLLELKKKIKSINIHICDYNARSATFGIKNIKKHRTPPVKKNGKKYISNLVSLVKNNRIELIIPLSDYEIILLAKNKKKFDDLNCKLAVSSKKICETFSDKVKSAKYCEANKILFPKTIPYNKLKNFNKSKEIVEKKISGSASEGIQILKKKSKISKKKNYFYQEFIKGIELNFDILNDLKGNYLGACVKQKLSMRSGETDSAKILTKEKYYKLAKLISKKIRHIGNLDCDAIEDKVGNIFFIDFNLRFGGGYAFTHVYGLDFIQALISSILNKNFKLKKIGSPKIFSKGVSIHNINA